MKDYIFIVLYIFLLSTYRAQSARSAQSAQSAQSAESEVECRDVWSVDCKGVECGVWSVKCGV